MSALPGVCLACGLTPEQVIEGLSELSQAGLDALGQPLLAALVPLVARVADDAAALLESGPTAVQVLTGEVDAEQAAAAAAEVAKFPKG